MSVCLSGLSVCNLSVCALVPCLSVCLYVCSATDKFCAAQEQEGVIASDSVQDVVLEDCHARALRFACPQMTHLSLKLTKVASFTLLNCSSLQSLDLQCELTILHQHTSVKRREKFTLSNDHNGSLQRRHPGAHTSITPSSLPVMTCIVSESISVKALHVDAINC